MMFRNVSLYLSDNLRALYLEETGFCFRAKRTVKHSGWKIMPGR